MGSADTPLDALERRRLLALERVDRILVGATDLEEALDATLDESGEAADDRLSVLYTCIGLGFQGWYAGQPEYLKKKMLECSTRLRDMMEADERAYLCHAAYDALDTRDLVQPPAKKLGGLAIAVVGFIVVMFIANIVAYRWSNHGIVKSLDSIIADSVEETSE